MGHREEERDHKAISSMTSRGALNCRPKLLRRKAAHILEQMVPFCNHGLQVGLAHICTDAC